MCCHFFLRSLFCCCQHSNNRIADRIPTPAFDVSDHETSFAIEETTDRIVELREKVIDTKNQKIFLPAPSIDSELKKTKDISFTKEKIDKKILLQDKDDCLIRINRQGRKHFKQHPIFILKLSNEKYLIHSPASSSGYELGIRVGKKMQWRDCPDCYLSEIKLDKLELIEVNK